MVHELPRHSLRLGVVLPVAQDVLGLEHEIGRLDVVAVGVVVGHGAPVRGEVQVQDSGLDSDLVPHETEELDEARAQRLVLPHLVELSERLEQVEERVVRLHSRLQRAGRYERGRGPGSGGTTEVRGGQQPPGSAGGVSHGGDVHRAAGRVRPANLSADGSAFLL